MELQSEHSRRRHRFPSLILGNSWIGRIDEKRYRLRRREQLAKDFERLRHYLPIQLGHARNITAGPAEARDEAQLNRISRESFRYQVRIVGDHRQKGLGFAATL